MDSQTHAELKLSQAYRVLEQHEAAGSAVSLL